MNFLTKSLLSLTLVATVASAGDFNDHCMEKDRAAKMGFGTAYLGLPLGPVGAIVGFAAGSILHDYGCELNDFAKPEEKMIEGKVVETMEVKSDVLIINDFATFDLNSKIPNHLDETITELDNDKIAGIVVTGHASEPGSEMYNNKLSLDRAIVIAKKLGNFVDQSKIAVAAEGENQAKYYFKDNNQRVDVEITFK